MRPANSPRGFYFLYGMLAVFVLLSLLGLPCLHAIRKREKIDTTSPLPIPGTAMRDSPSTVP